MAKKIKEEVKFTLSEIKKNIQETNSEGKEAGIQINNLEQKEEINIQPEQKEETKIQKNKMKSLETYETALNVPTSKS